MNRFPCVHTFAAMMEAEGLCEDEIAEEMVHDVLCEGFEYTTDDGAVTLSRDAVISNAIRCDVDLFDSMIEAIEDGDVDGSVEMYDEALYAATWDLCIHLIRDYEYIHKAT